MLPWQCGHVIRGGVLKESCLKIAEMVRFSFYSSCRGAERFFNEKSLRKADASRRLKCHVRADRLVAFGVEVQEPPTVIPFQANPAPAEGYLGIGVERADVGPRSG